MRGTTSALRALFGNGLGTDRGGEYVEPVNGRRFHIFDGFALVNRLLCSASPTNRSRPLNRHHARPMREMSGPPWASRPDDHRLAGGCGKAVDPRRARPRAHPQPHPVHGDPRHSPTVV